MNINEKITLELTMEELQHLASLLTAEDFNHVDKMQRLMAMHLMQKVYLRIVTRLVKASLGPQKAVKFKLSVAESAAVLIAMLGRQYQLPANELYRRNLVTRIIGIIHQKLA